MESMKNLATGLVSDPNKSMHDGLCIDEKCADLESHVLQLLEIDTITAQVTSIAFMKNQKTGVGPVGSLFLRY